MKSYGVEYILEGEEKSEIRFFDANNEDEAIALLKLRLSAIGKKLKQIKFCGETSLKKLWK